MDWTTAHATTYRDRHTKFELELLLDSFENTLTIWCGGTFEKYKAPGYLVRTVLDVVASDVEPSPIANELAAALSELPE